MPLKSAADLTARLTAMEKTLTGRDMGKRFKLLEPSLHSVARAAGAGDLGGDRKFTGWPGPDALDVVVRLHRNGQGITVGRSRGSAGPWRVAQQGRNQGETGLALGPGINTRTGLTSRTKSGGLRKVRTFKAKRWNGVTQGKGTWGKAAASMTKVAGPQFSKITRKAVADAFTKGH